MAYTNILAPNGLISIDSAAFTGSYQLLTASGGLTLPAGYICFSNASSVAVTVSFDGVNDHDIVRPSTDKSLYAQQISLPQSNVCYIPAGQRIWVKGTAGTGLFYLSSYRNAKSQV